MTAEVASASVALLPTFQGGAAAIQRELGGPIAQAGQQGGQAYGNGVMSTFSKFAAPIAGIFAGAKVIEFLNDSTAAASDLNEAGAAGGEVFGQAFAQVEAYADAAATKLGQSKLDALDGARTFGVFGKAAGLAGSDLVDFSTGLVGLSGDLASFYNTSPEQAITAVGAALRGESEPIRQYGVLLDDATLKARALSSGLIQASVDEVKVTAARRKLTDATAELNDAQATYGEGSDEYAKANEKVVAAQAALEDSFGGTVQALTPAQKTMAAYQEILAQTSVAQGDFERTSDGLANQQRTAAAELENFKAKFGEALLPIATDVVTSLNTDLFPALEKILPVVKDGIGEAAPVIVDLVSGLFPLIETGTELASNVLPPLAGGLVFITQAAAPLLDVVGDLDPELIAVVAGFVALNKLRPAVVDFFDRSSKALQTYQDKLALQAALSQPMTQSYRGLQDLGKQIDYTEKVGGRLLGRFSEVGSTALFGLGAASDGVKGKLSILGDDVGKLPNKLGSFTSFLGGPWGAAIGIGVGVLSALAVELIPKAAENIDELTSSFEKNTGAITDNTRVSVFKALQDAGAVDAAKKIGINLETLTDAALGNAAAIAEVDAATAAYNETQKSFTTGTTGGSSNMTSEAQAITNAIGSQNDAVATATQNFRDQQEAAGAAGQAQNAFAASVTAAQAALAQNGATLDENTAQGIANKDALRSLAEEAATLVDTNVGLGKGSAELQSIMAGARDEFIQTAIAMGQPRDQAVALADEMLKIPEQKVITVTADTQPAMDSLEAIRSYWLTRGIDIPAYVIRQDEAAANRGADGYATGGTIVGPGTSKSDDVLMWGSSGEEVIQEPYASRHRALLKAINAGADPSARFASGGTVGGGSVAPIVITRDVSLTAIGAPGQSESELVRIMRNDFNDELRVNG